VSNGNEAVVLNAYSSGAAELVMSVINNGDIPKPAGHELIVKVEAIGINPLDCEVRRGYGAALLGRISPLPCIRGQEAVGVVTDIGAHVWDYKVGDKVWVSLSPLTGGAYQSYIKARPEEVSLRPPSLSLREAAALPFAVTTLWTALNHDGPGRLLQHCVDTAPIASTSSSLSSPTLSYATPMPSPMSYLRCLSNMISRASMVGAQVANAAATSPLPAYTWSSPLSPSSPIASFFTNSFSSPPSSSSVSSSSGSSRVASRSLPSSLVHRMPTLTSITASRAGARVFINGGSGSIGSLAIQWLRFYGYHITATCGPKSVERLKSLGCDDVLDYTRDDYHTLYSGQGAFDYFLDCQGGVASDARGEQRYNDDEAKAASILKRGGHLATFRGALMRSINAAPNVVQGLAYGTSLLLQKQAEYGRQYGITYDWYINQPNHYALAHMTALVESGHVMPFLDQRTFHGLPQVIAAHSYLDRAQQHGKVVVTL